MMLHRAGNKIVAVVSRDRNSARKCGRLMSCRNCSDDISAIPSSSDLVIITVPDQSIRSVAESLAALSHLNFRRIAVCHTSGALTSDVLEAVARGGARVLSLHPIQTFPAKNPLEDQIRSMKGITYGFEGPSASLPMARRLIGQLGGNILVVPKEAKILYHLACVIASNYSMALIGAVETITREFSRKGLQPFRKLIETSIDNAMTSGASRALTGPIVRGDVEVVEAHLKSMDDQALKELYKSLGLYTLEFASKEHKLSPEEIQRFRDLLEDQA
jgi:predicted short-subunit dehydrogenase-like oxidoreductase (DUF2520 family)